MKGLILFLLFLLAAGGYAFVYLRGSKTKWQAAENCLIAAKMYSELVEEDKIKINQMVIRKSPSYGLSQDRESLVRLLNEHPFTRAHCYARVFSETGILPNVHLKRWHWLDVTDPLKLLSTKDREYKFTVDKLSKEVGQTLSMEMGSFVSK